MSGENPSFPSAMISWCRAAGVVVLKGVLLFLLLNLLLYLVSLAMRPKRAADPLSRYGSDKLQKAYPGWQGEDVRTLIRETFRDMAFEYEPFTGFRNTPFRGKYVNIDPAGFRFSKDQASWPPPQGATNIFVFGGSTALGVGLPDDETIASHLLECAPANRSHLAVYNFGRSYYFSSQELILFQSLLNAGFVPQVAVFIDGINDFGTPDGQPAFGANFRRFMAAQAGPSLLYNLPVVWAAHRLRDHWRKPQPLKATDYADPAALQRVIDRWLANKRMIELMASGFGVRTIFVWQPAPMYKYDFRYDPFPAEDFGTNRRAEYGYPLMENLRAQGKLGDNVLWLADMQQNKHENLYVDSFHYTAAFSKEIAAQICGFLLEHPQSADYRPKSAAVSTKRQ